MYTKLVQWYSSSPHQSLLETRVLLLQLFDLCTAGHALQPRVTDLLFDNLQVDCQLLDLLLHRLGLLL